MKTKKVTTPSIQKLAALAVLPHGFVYVGTCSIEDVEGHPSLIVEDCRNLRRWGTNKGLGQLAIEGKQSETVMDEVGLLVAAYPQQVLQIIPLSETAKASFGL
jgi:hypothetical protein